MHDMRATTDKPGLRHRTLRGLQLYVTSMFPIPKLDVAGLTPGRPLQNLLVNHQRIDQLQSRRNLRNMDGQTETANHDP